MKDYLGITVKEDLFASDGYVHAAPNIRESGKNKSRRHCVKKRTTAAEREKQICLNCKKECCTGTYYCMHKQIKRKDDKNGT